jgi:hypothetical protein
MKLRLFVLRNTVTNQVVPDLFFANKPDAKRERDSRGIPGSNEFVVSPGPDHRRHESKKQ